MADRPADSAHQSNDPTRPGWPGRLIVLGRQVAGTRADTMDGPNAQLWLLLNDALQERIRRESRRTGPIGPEDVEDLAAEKALDLMTRLDEGKWDLAESTPEKVVAFVGTVARNGLIDLLRRGSTRAQTETDVETLDDTPRELIMSKADHPDMRPERTQFVQALADCASKLSEEHRTIWLFRVFLDLPSKRIASHPEVALKPSHVDVILQRCRGKIRDCMQSKGFDVTHVPTGSFAELWRTFRLDDHLEEGKLDHG